MSEVTLKQTTLLITSATLRAQLGGISEMTLYRRLRDPVNPLPQPIRLGGSVRFWPANEIEAWLQECADHAPVRA
jgi:predicted DNA-binding transcriptional regulator AlpA